MAELCRDFWIRETGTGQQVSQLHDRYDDDDDDDDNDDKPLEKWLTTKTCQETHISVEIKNTPIFFSLHISTLRR